ncbi:MAG: MarR family winged helix-turn-helix transcriptional regulator [Candidatus Dormibacteria bacterium]
MPSSDRRGGFSYLRLTPPAPPARRGAAATLAPPSAAAEGLLTELLSGWLETFRPASTSAASPFLPDGQSLTRHQLRALRSLPAGGLTMRSFAQALGVSGGSATALADRLIRSGAVERQTDTSDRRVVRLIPTAAGARLATASRGAQDAAVAGLLALMPAPSRAALMGAMDYVLALLGDSADPPSEGTTAYEVGPRTVEEKRSTHHRAGPAIAANRGLHC